MITNTLTTPRFLLAFFAAVAAMSTDTYQVCAWNLGTVQLDPWRVRSSDVMRTVTQGVRAWLLKLRTSPLAFTCGAVLLALLVAHLAGAGHHSGDVSIAIGGFALNGAQLRGAIEEQKAAVATTMARAQREGRNLTAEERQTVENHLLEAKKLHASLERVDGDSALTAMINRLGGGDGVGRRPGDGARSGGSLGAQFVSSDAYRWLSERKGKLPTGSWTSDSSELAFDIGATTITEDPAVAGDLVLPDYQQRIVGLRQRRIFMAQLFAAGTTGSNSVVSMVETAFTNAAAATAEGAAKPESALNFDAVTDPVIKIPHWIPLSEEVLEDVAQLRSYVDARLRLGVNLALDNQLLNGSGVSPNMKGVLNRTGLAAAVARGADTNADAILKQIAAIASDKDVVPDGIVMHPTNWLTIQLLKNATGDYYQGGGPWAMPRTPMLWGLPVALTTAITLNTALVGAFTEGGQLFVRSGIRVEVSNAHQDYFIKNLVAMRAEMRAALAVTRADCFGTVTGLN